jgi:hypothetical protein
MDECDYESAVRHYGVDFSGILIGSSALIYTVLALAGTILATCCKYDN